MPHLLIPHFIPSIELGCTESYADKYEGMDFAFGTVYELVPDGEKYRITKDTTNNSINCKEKRRAQGPIAYIDMTFDQKSLTLKGTT